MPLVRISLKEGRSPSDLSAISEAIHRAMVETINVPPDDRFQILQEHSPQTLVADRLYLGIERSENVVIIQITLNLGRTVEQKRALYRAIADNLASSPGLRREDILISLVEVPKENWSFGNGEMSYGK
jgi:phenylpyruvate tautomerase PptA (4-oxalocrotonate tautomerase family)